MNSNRDASFDILKGIGILSVIIGHNVSFDSSLRIFIYSFHMPLFFLCAGYFLKNVSPSTQIKKDFKRLILPYIVVSLVLLLSSMALWLKDHGYPIISQTILPLIWGAGGPHNEVMIFNTIQPLTQLWFLLALFWGKLVSNILPRHLGGVLTGIVISIVATLVGRYVIFLPSDICEGLSAVAFIMIGVYLKDHGLNKGLLLLMLIAWIVSITFFDLALSICEFSNYPIQVLGATGGTIAFYYLSKLISKNRMICLVLSLFGVNSMAILCMHTIESHTIIWRFLPMPHFSILPVVWKIGFCVIATFLLSKWKYTKELFGIVFVNYENRIT